MDWQDIGVLVAMVGVIGGFVLTWRGQKQDKELSEATAERAEAAAALSADNTERVLSALEAIAAKDFGGGAGPTPPARVKWSMTQQSTSMYVLTNEGDAVAYGVELSGHSTLRGPDVIGGGPDLQPGEALTFAASVVLATSDTMINVTWLDDPGATQRQQWRYPLPFRSPRRG